MGIMIIPYVSSLSDDVINSVPQSLRDGSYAIGATKSETIKKVVIPAALPGIIGSVLLAVSRAIGETMIVLMASGNTPLMEANIFEGMRTLSANLAVEMAEAEVASSHYRVLFLSGLVLFIFTFFFNTLAEVVRQRMRRKYGSL